MTRWWLAVQEMLDVTSPAESALVKENGSNAFVTQSRQGGNNQLRGRGQRGALSRIIIDDGGKALEARPRGRPYIQF